MAATAKNFDNTKTIWNFADIWVNCGLPAVGAKPVIASDGTPDSATSPTCKHVGYLRGDTKVMYKSTKKDARDAQHTAPHRSRRDEESVRVESRWLQVLDTDLLDILVDGVTVSTVTGGKLVEAGGKRDIATSVVYVIAERTDAPGKYLCAVIFAAIFTEGLELTFNQEAEMDAPFGLDGQIVPSRADGKQLWSWYIDDSA